MICSLEYALRKFTALTQNETIMIRHGSSEHRLNVIKVEPVLTSPAAICVIDTNLQVDPVLTSPAAICVIDTNLQVCVAACCI
jgi:hypothetical protein